MKNKAIFSMLFCVTTFLSAQKVDTLTDELRKCTSAEQALGLPSGYVVIQCKIYMNSKSEIYAVSYLRCSDQLHHNANCRDFTELWSQFAIRAQKGDHVGLEDITVQKGDRQMKWMPKTFVVP